MERPIVVLAVLLTGMPLVFFGRPSANAEQSDPDGLVVRALPSSPLHRAKLTQWSEQINQDAAKQESGTAASESAKSENVAGKWDLTMGGREGNHTYPMTLQHDGSSIQGILHAARGDMPISGTLNGNQIRFSGPMSRGEQKTTVNFMGTVSGDTMTGTASPHAHNVKWKWSARRKKE